MPGLMMWVSLFHGSARPAAKVETGCTYIDAQTYYTMGCLQVKGNGTVNGNAHHRVLSMMFDLSYRGSACPAVGYSISCLREADQ